MQYNTESRKKILAFIKKSPERSFTAEEIVSSEELSSVAKSTVFRRLAQLTREGEIRRINDTTSRKVTYQYIDKEKCSEHIHLKCNTCGKLFHIDGLVSQIIEKNILESGGFRLDSATLLIGTCRSCLAAGGKR